MVDCIVHKLHMVKLLAHTKMEKKNAKPDCVVKLVYCSFS